MNSLTTTVCPAALERVHYFSRQLITADDMMAEQEYFREKLRRHNRYLHGWGVVCGCEVEPYPDASHPWQVRICPGYIITPQGDEILIGQPVNFDLGGDSRQPQDPCANPLPCPPTGTRPGADQPQTVYVAVCYTECETRPVRVHPVGCACDEAACDYSRIRDSFEVQRLSSLPSSYTTPPPTAILCDFINNQVVPDCPKCPSDPWVVLAAVSLPASLSVKVTDTYIDNFTYRRQILSTAVLQQQIIKCCCQPRPARVTNFSGGGAMPVLNVVVTFDKRLQPASVNATTFQIVNADTNAVVPGVVTYDDPSKSAMFSVAAGFPAGDYNVTLIGDGNSPITDVDGLALDGDGDGKPGGNYKKQFGVG